MLFAIAGVLATPPLTFPAVALVALGVFACARRARLRLVAR